MISVQRLRQKIGGKYFTFPSRTFKYTQLPTSPPHIRLLKLLGIGNIALRPLLVDIVIVSYSDILDYIALSYTWGDQEKTEVICTPDGQLPVTANLNDALRRIFYEHGSQTYVWADAVCIDQANHKEKETQLLRIPSIYANAKIVAAYIGDNKPYSDEEDNILRNIVTKIAKFNLKDDFEKLGYFGDPGTGNLPHDASWLALRNFLARPWFRRTWIIQECVLAKNLRVYWESEYSLDWETFKKICVFVRLSGTPMFPMRFDPDDEPHEDSIKGLTCLSEMVLIKGGWENDDKSDLFELLQKTRLAESTLKLDKYFALLGLAKDAARLAKERLQPDYTASFADISIRFSEYFLRSEPANLGRFLRHAQPRKPDSTLPSWIPDWTQPIFMVRPVGLSDSRLSSQFTPRFSLKSSLSASVLRVIGFSLGAIDMVGHDPWTAGKDVPQKVQAAMDDIWFHGDREVLKPYSTEEHISEVLWRTFTCDIFFENIDPLYHQLTGGQNALLEDSLSAARELFDATPRFSDEERHQRMQDWRVPAYEIVLGKFCEVIRGRRFAIIRRNETPPSNNELKNDEYQSNYYVAMAPVTAQEGDTVVLIMGTEVPFVIRKVTRPHEPATKQGNKQTEYLPTKRQEDTYTLVGECYVHGVMRGELFEGRDAASSNYDWREFHLV